LMKNNACLRWGLFLVEIEMERVLITVKWPFDRVDGERTLPITRPCYCRANHVDCDGKSRC
jgi:hypothetical protein